MLLSRTSLFSNGSFAMHSGSNSSNTSTTINPMVNDVIDKNKEEEEGSKLSESSRTSISQSMENLSFNKKKNTASSTLSSSSSGTGVKVEYDL